MEKICDRFWIQQCYTLPNTSISVAFFKLKEVQIIENKEFMWLEWF